MVVWKSLRNNTCLSLAYFLVLSCLMYIVIDIPVIGLVYQLESLYPVQSVSVQGNCINKYLETFKNVIFLLWYQQT